MAERRMFAKSIVLSDAFLDMPMSARCLYFTLGMFADDDGFVNSPRGIMRQCGASDDDMKVLLSKRFVLLFDSGIIVIKHWRINNYLRNDRYKETVYTDEYKQLTTDKNGAYSLGIPSNGIPSIGKVSIDKNSIDKERGKFIPPTLEELTKYCAEKGYTFDPESFINYYNSNGWKVGRNPMKNWHSAVANWAKREKDFAPKRRTDVMPEYMNNTIDQPAEEHTAEDIERMLKQL